MKFNWVRRHSCRQMMSGSVAWNMALQGASRYVAQAWPSGSSVDCRMLKDISRKEKEPASPG